MRHVKLPYEYWFIKVRDRDKKPITVWKNSSHDFHPKSYSHTHTQLLFYPEMEQGVVRRALIFQFYVNTAHDIFKD